MHRQAPPAGAGQQALAHHAFHRAAFGRGQLLGELLQARIVNHNAHRSLLKLIWMVTVSRIESKRLFWEIFLAVERFFGSYSGLSPKRGVSGDHAASANRVAISSSKWP